MANIGNAERCNGLEQLGIDLTGTDTQRHCDEKFSADQKCKGTDTLAKKRICAEKRGFASRRAATAWHSWYAEKCNDKQRHRYAGKETALHSWKG